jgi:predicted DsbA family dithiol-disulfide isomerase
MNTQNEADAIIIEAAQALEKSLQTTARYQEMNQRLLDLIERSTASSEELVRHLKLTQAMLVISFDMLSKDSFEGDRETTMRFVLEIAEATGLDTEEAEALMGSITDALTQAGSTVH